MMDNYRRSAFIRIILVVTLGAAISLVWESSSTSGYKPVAGTVVARGYRDYVVCYELHNQSQKFVTRIGILDLLFHYQDFQPGGKVPVLASPTSPHQAVINTLNGRYRITLCFVGLLLIILTTIAVLIIKGSPNAQQPQ